MTKPNPDHKIGICHNPPGQPGHYNYQEVDEASITKEQGHDNDAGDIIPAFEGYAGKNINPDNLALLARECKAQTTTTTTTKPYSDETTSSTTSTTKPATTTTRPTTTTTVLIAAPTLDDPMDTVAPTTTLSDAPATAALVSDHAAAMLPVTGSSPLLAGAGMSLILVGAAILKAVRRT